MGNRAEVIGRLVRRWMLVVVAAVTLLIVPLASAGAAEKRVALVIGNGAYRHAATLKNARADAKLMAETLGDLGFRVIGDGALIDAERPAMEQAIRSFGKALREGAVGVFYYSGHGLQVKGTNYIVPVSAKVADEADVKYELLDVGFVLDEMGNAHNRLNIVILDACRNNPLGGGGLRSAGNGLATMTAPAGTAIAFATQPGNVARDGAGSHSPYTEALAKALRIPGLDLFDTFNDVGLAVKKSTGGNQQPWLSSSPIEGQFYFAGTGGQDVRPVDNSADVARARAELDRLKRETDQAKAAAEAARAQARAEAEAEEQRQQAREEARAAREEARREQEREDAREEARAAREEARREQEREEARRQQAREDAREEARAAARRQQAYDDEQARLHLQQRQQNPYYWMQQQPQSPQYNYGPGPTSQGSLSDFVAPQRHRR